MPRPMMPALLLLAVLPVGLASPPALAQSSGDASAPAAEEEAAAPDASESDAADLDAADAAPEDPPLPEDFLLTEEELDEIVAPVALYPDALLAQVFVASTFPLDIVKAQRWAEDAVDLPDEERADAALAEDWDPAVAALAAGFPDVVGRMADELEWTETLGDALLAQSDDVLDAVQRQRARAAAVGNLESNEAQTVSVADDAIAIAPADPEVVYVPAYDPGAVYTETAKSPPVVYAEDDPGWSDGEVLVTGAIAFGAGMLVNEVFRDDDDWRGYWGPSYRPVGWNGGRIYPRPGRRPGRGGIGGGNFRGNDVDIGEVNINRNRRDMDRDGAWRPDDRRRREAEKKLSDRKRPGGARTASRGDRNRPAAGGGARPDLGGRDRDRRNAGGGDRPNLGGGDRDRPNAAGGGRDRPNAGGGRPGGDRDALRAKLSARSSDGVKGLGRPAGARDASARPKTPPKKPSASRGAFSGARDGKLSSAKREASRGAASKARARPAAARPAAARPAIKPKAISRPGPAAARPAKAPPRKRSLGGGGRKPTAFNRSGGGRAAARGKKSGGRLKRR